jgi:hypothetical protein
MRHKRHVVIVSTVIGLLWAALSRATEATPELRVDEFGIHEGKSIDSGFVFHNGRYLPPPYKVTRKGVVVFINDTVMVAKPPPRWPLPDLTVAEDPGIPDATRFEDIIDVDNPENDHLGKKSRYLFQHYPEDIAVQKLVEYFTALSFVKSATVFENRIYELTCMNGGTFEVTVDPPGKGMPGLQSLTPEEMLAHIERQRDRYETRLKEGDCFLFTERREMRFGKKWAARDLGLLVEVLRSKRSAEEKELLVTRMNMIPVGSGRLYVPLFTKFEAPDDLEKRIGELVKEMKVTPRRLEDLPEETPSMRSHRLIREEMRREREKRKAKESCE